MEWNDITKLSNTNPEHSMQFVISHVAVRWSVEPGQGDLSTFCFPSLNDFLTHKQWLFEAKCEVRQLGKNEWWPIWEDLPYGQWLRPCSTKWLQSDWAHFVMHLLNTLNYWLIHWRAKPKNTLLLFCKYSIASPQSPQPGQQTHTHTHTAVKSHRVWNSHITNVACH